MSRNNNKTTEHESHKVRNSIIIGTVAGLVVSAAGVFKTELENGMHDLLPHTVTTPDNPLMKAPQRVDLHKVKVPLTAPLLEAQGTSGATTGYSKKICAFGDNFCAPTGLSASAEAKIHGPVSLKDGKEVQNEDGSTKYDDVSIELRANENALSFGRGTDENGKDYLIFTLDAANTKYVITNSYQNTSGDVGPTTGYMDFLTGHQTSPRDSAVNLATASLLSSCDDSLNTLIPAGLAATGKYWVSLLSGIYKDGTPAGDDLKNLLAQPAQEKITGIPPHVDSPKSGEKSVTSLGVTTTYSQRIDSDSCYYAASAVKDVRKLSEGKDFIEITGSAQDTQSKGSK